MKASLPTKPMYCSREYFKTSRLIQQYEKPTSNYTSRIWDRGAVHLFRGWERLQLREIDYENHKIFTLRCLHRELVPVSLKLKSTLNTTRAKQIIRKAEKDLIQARIKSINNILTNVAIQLEQCRSQLASIISTERLRECQGFVDKVGETRFNKVKNRQIKKFQNLLNKKGRKYNLVF